MSDRPSNGPRRSKRLRRAAVAASASSSDSDCSSPRYRFPDSDEAVASRPHDIEAEDKCSICLQRLQGPELGSPGGCSHVFCLECIVKWSMSSNTCPVDRDAFYTISVRRHPGGPVVRVINLCSQLKQQSMHPTACEMCVSAEGSATMLICDNCSRGFHLECLRPTLEQLPNVQWICPGCNTQGDVSFHQIVVMLSNFYGHREYDRLDDVSSEEEEGREEFRRFLDHMRAEPEAFYQHLRNVVPDNFDLIAGRQYHLEHYDSYNEPQPSTSTGRTGGEGGSRRPPPKKRKYKRRTRPMHTNYTQAKENSIVLMRNKKQEVSVCGDMLVTLCAVPVQEEVQPTTEASPVLAVGPTSDILTTYRQARIKMASSSLLSILDAHTVLRAQTSLLSVEGFLERIVEPRPVFQGKATKMDLERISEKTRAAGGGYQGSGGGRPPSRPTHAPPRPAHAAHRPAPPAPYDPTQPTRGDSSEDDGDCPNFSVYSATSVHIAGRDDDEEADERCPLTRNTRTPIKIKFNTHTLLKRPVGLYDDEEDSMQDDMEESVANADVVQQKGLERVLDDIDDFEIDKVRDSNEMESVCDVAAPSTEKEAADQADNGVISNNGHHVNNTDDVVSDNYEDISLKEEEREEANELFDDDLDSQNCKKTPLDNNGEKKTESISETEDERSYTPCLDENKSKDNSLEVGKENIGIEGLDTEMISEDEGNELFSDGERSDKSRRIVKRENRVLDKEDGEISEKRKGLADTSNRDDPKRKKKKESKRDSKDKRIKNKKSDVTFKKLSKNGKERNYRDKEDRNNRHSSSDRDKMRRKEKRKDLQRYDVRTLVGRKRQKDPFGRDVSPARHSRTPSPVSIHYRDERRRRDFSRRSDSRGRNSISRSATPNLSSTRRSLTPSRRRSTSRKKRRSMSPKPRRSISIGADRAQSLILKRSASPRPRRSASPKIRRSPSPRARRSVSPRNKRSTSPRGRRSISRSRRKRSASVRRKSPSPARRRATPVRGRKRQRRSSSRTPRLKLTKKKRRSRSRPLEKRSRKNKRKSKSPRKKSPKQKKKKAAKSPSPELELSPALWPDSDDPAYAWSGGSPGLTPPRRRDPPGKEVFTSGDNILVSVSFDDEGRRRRRPRRDLVAKPVAIIDLDRSPFREITPSPENVIVLSDSSPSPPAPGPKTPPTPVAPDPPPPTVEPAPYDPFEPTKSPEPAPILMTLETAQQTNMSADDVVNQRPVSPLEKVLALLQSTRDLCPAPAPYEQPALPPAPSPPPTQPEPAPELESPYSPGSGDFGDLFSPPPQQDAAGSTSAQDAFDVLFGKQNKGKSKDAKERKPKKGAADKSRVGVRLDEDDLKILDELPNSAVEMQVKSKFLKKLNRQERVVEEVKLVLKPHYNKKRLSKDDYKDILRRAVPKICHNKSGEINPAKIQALVEAYVRKFRKRRKLGLL